MAAPTSPSKQKNSAGAFLKSTFAKHKKTVPITTDITDSVTFQAPRIPSLDLNPNNRAVFRESSNNGNIQSRKDTQNDSTQRPKIVHKQSSSNMSVKNILGDKFSKQAKQPQISINTDLQSKKAKSKAKTPTSPPASLPQIPYSHAQKAIINNQEGFERWTEAGNNIDQTYTLLQQKVKAEERDKENERPAPITKVELPQLQEEINRYTPNVYCAATQRNFFAEQPRLVPKAPPVITGKRKTSGTSILSTKGSIGDIRQEQRRSGEESRNPIVKHARKVSAEIGDILKKRNAGGESGISYPKAVNTNQASLHCSLTFQQSNGPMPATTSAERPPNCDPVQLERDFEAMLDRRGIAPNVRKRMRSQTLFMKAELIMQDIEESAVERATKAAKVAELEASKPSENSKRTRDRSQSPTKRPKSAFLSYHTSIEHHAGRKAVNPGGEKERPRSMMNILKKSGSSGSLFKDAKNSMKRKKDKGDNSRPQSMYGAPPTASASTSSLVTAGSFPTGGVRGRTAEDFMEYLGLTNPNTCEVGWLHKLKIHLRSERLSWVSTFIKDGGFELLLKLLYSLLDIEWRDGHHEQLLKWCLVDLKALGTSPDALFFLNKHHDELFTRLVHLLFDPEHKGPSEFATRELITHLMFVHLEHSPMNEQAERARSLLRILRDPTPPEEERPVEWIERIRVSRPYKRWNKELTDVTKEVYWIFNHNKNIVPLLDVNPFDKYAEANFPGPHAPVGAAPHVGGPEFDSTNYLGSHLDLLNAIIAYLPTQDERNAIRLDLKNSGFEKVMGGTLRLVTPKFYWIVHDGLKTWVAAAVADGWTEGVNAVRCGIFPESEAPGANVKTYGKKKKVEPPPKLDMPFLGFEVKTDPLLNALVRNVLDYNNTELIENVKLKPVVKSNADMEWKF